MHSITKEYLDDILHVHVSSFDYELLDDLNLVPGTTLWAIKINDEKTPILFAKERKEDITKGSADIVSDVGIFHDSKKSKSAYEALHSKYASEHGCNVPVYCSFYNPGGNRSIILTEYIHGNSLENLLVGDGDNHVEEIVRAALYVLRQFHEIGTKFKDELEAIDKLNHIKYSRKLKNYMRGWISWTYLDQNMDDELWNGLYSFKNGEASKLRELTYPLMKYISSPDRNKCYIHGSMMPAHVMWDGEAIICDLDEVRMGHAYSDVLRFLLNPFLNPSRSQLEGFLKDYGIDNPKEKDVAKAISFYSIYEIIHTIGLATLNEIKNPSGYETVVRKKPWYSNQGSRGDGKWPSYVGWYINKLKNLEFPDELADFKNYLEEKNLFTTIKPANGIEINGTSGLPYPEQVRLIRERRVATKVA